MLELLVQGVAISMPLLLLAWGVCWWMRTPRWLLAVLLIGASPLGYVVSRSWVLPLFGETDENVSEARDVIEVGLAACQLIALVLVLPLALAKQKKRIEARPSVEPTARRS